MGIGLAIAHRFVARGARVTLLARSAAPLAAARGELLARTPEATVATLVADVTDEHGSRAAIEHVMQTDPIDLLVNSAGITHPGRFLELEPERYRAQMETNFFGAVHVTRVVAPQMVSRRRGYVVHVGSLASVAGIYGFSAYAPTKFALQGFAECLRAELRPHGIDVSLLLPPDTDTPMHRAEIPLLPAETRAIAGALQVLSPERVALALERGMDRRRFAIVPGVDARLTELAARWLPGLVRWFVDRRSDRARA